MLKNSLMYFVILNLIQFLLVGVNCQKTPFKPSQRYLHTATFIDNKLYILGGRFTLDVSLEAVGKDFFYLDFSKPFDIQNSLWQDLSSINIVPSHIAAAAVKGGDNNNTLFVYGGNSTNNEMAPVYTFDNSWRIPTKLADNNIFRKALLTGIVDNRKMYLWGGKEARSGNFSNDMLILDTINLSSGVGNLVSAPTPRINYGATLLPNHNIIYIGGRGNDGKLIALNQVYMYDTINDSWNIKVTSGKIPSDREGFSVNAGLDGQRAIIFGGKVDSANQIPTDPLYVLDLIKFEWYIPKVSGKLPLSRNMHKANVIGKYIVISFGDGYNQLNENDVLLLDISNNEEYIWTTNFFPPVTIAKTNINSKPLLKIISIVVGGLIGGSIAIFIIIYLYRQNRRNKHKKEQGLYEEFGIDNQMANTTNPVIPTNNRVHNHEQEAVPNDNQGTSTQNIDNATIQQLKNEMIQAVRQEMQKQK